MRGIAFPDYAQGQSKIQGVRDCREHGPCRAGTD